MIKIHRLKLKKLLFFFMILNGFLLLIGMILLSKTIIGVIIIIFSLFSLLFSYYELRKYIRYEEIKSSYTLDSLADFSNTLYELSYRRKEK